jgi:DNA (cytosine-5)-methyltransferase 3A
MRILHEVQPKYFFLENVIMSEKWERILSKAIGVNPIEINSALFSAQNRRRLYWTNIGLKPSGLFGHLESIIEQPKDRGILLKDILETEVDQKYYLSEKMLDYFQVNNQNQKENGNGFKFDPINDYDQKSKSITTKPAQRMDDNFIVASRGRNPENPKSREIGLNTEQHLEPRIDGKTNCLTSVQKDNLVIQLNTSKESGGKQPYQHNRVYDVNGISPCLNTDSRSPAIQIQKDNLVAYGCDFRSDEGFRIRNEEKSSTLMARSREDIYGTGLVKLPLQIRRLTPVECERLQTVPDNYTNHVSDSQRYKMLGNGWTVDVIAYIFQYLSLPSQGS